MALAFALAACGGSDEADTTVAGPPPSEATIFQASTETTSDLGIVKWGFAADEAGDLTTYRGYGAKNEVLATVTQTMDRRDPEAYHFAMTVTATNAALASEKIDFTTRAADDGVSAAIVMLVTENTIEDGSVASKVLAHFKADSGNRGGTTTSGGSLLGQSRPLDGNSLVGSCSNTVDRCQVELIDQRIAASAASGDCGLLKLVGQPLIATVIGAGVGALASWWTGPGVVAGAVIGGAGAGVAGGAAAGVQCADSRRGATKANADLAKCRKDQAASCPTSH